METKQEDYSQPLTSSNFNLSELFKGFSDQMQIDFSKLTKQFQASTLKGSTRENILKTFLRKHLYGFLAVGSGEIVSVNGSRSKEQDVVIYDKLKCPIFTKEGDKAIFPCEGVYGVVEVKSKLDKKELEDAVEKIRSVKRLKKEAYRSDPLDVRTITIAEQGETKNYYNTIGIIFAFDSIDIYQLGSHLTGLNYDLKIPVKERVDFVCVVNKGLLFNYDTEGKRLRIMAEENSQIVVNHDQPDKALIMLYYILMERFGAIYNPPIAVQRYAQFWLNFVGTVVTMTEPGKLYQAPRGRI